MFHSEPDFRPPQSPVELYRTACGRPITFDEWCHFRHDHIVRQVEILAAILTDDIPTSRTPDLEQRVDRVLATEAIVKLHRLMSQLPAQIQPAPMTRLELLSFSLRLAGRIVRSSARRR